MDFADFLNNDIKICILTPLAGCALRGVKFLRFPEFLKYET